MSSSVLEPLLLQLRPSGDIIAKRPPTKRSIFQDSADLGESPKREMLKDWHVVRVTLLVSVATHAVSAPTT